MPSGSGQLRVGLRALERELLSSGALVDVSHPGSSSFWLEAPSLCLETWNDLHRAQEYSSSCDVLDVYRHMTDRELDFLIANGQLPATQPNQTIVCQEQGYRYCRNT
mmetsp:Transcript_8654/g.13690  ORF Transcript_8654/g.13690 Transcript_8654/m.13690 type:complete len:107 (+) Transcript_8654:374-694(+)